MSLRVGGLEETGSCASPETCTTADALSIDVGGVPLTPWVRSAMTSGWQYR
jgi:hypothetical protein